MQNQPFRQVRINVSVASLEKEVTDAEGKKSMQPYEGFVLKTECSDCGKPRQVTLELGAHPTQRALTELKKDGWQLLMGTTQGAVVLCKECGEVK